MPDIQRQTAYKCNINTVLASRYIQQQGWEPNYLEKNDKKISRVNILAAVVSKENNTITIDDGTGQINLMLFSDHEKAENIDVADIILVIGKPREYNNQRYIVPEILKKIQNTKWIQYRKMELNLDIDNKNHHDNENTQDKLIEKPLKKQIPPLIEIKKPENISQKIVETIRKLDKGDGAEIEQVIDQIKNSDAEKYITLLINEGEIFEARPGKIKILE
ncbi:OB-fold nucleic acid binding domain-containing protein [Candidatus Woesearchaeota archaeon]|nr:OB-fold nucleic acid binding domain-containing protein [Candidatus Woesearchaeota archaeon]